MTRLPLRLPHRPFAIAIIIRGSVIWIAVRAAMTSATALGWMPDLVVDRAGGPASNPGWAVFTSIGVVALVTALVRLDLARLNEHLFLASLGVRTGMLTALAALPPLVLEAAFGALGPGGLAALSP